MQKLIPSKILKSISMLPNSAKHVQICSPALEQSARLNIASLPIQAANEVNAPASIRSSKKLTRG